MENESVYLNIAVHAKWVKFQSLFQQSSYCTYIFLLCLQNVTANGEIIYKVQFDPACKYRAGVRILFSKTCGAGGSDLSDEVEYGTSGPSIIINNDHHSLFRLSVLKG